MLSRSSYSTSIPPTCSQGTPIYKTHVCLQQETFSLETVEKGLVKKGHASHTTIEVNT